MRSSKALAAICSATFFGMIVSTFLPGCQPAAPVARSTDTDAAGPEVSIPESGSEKESAASPNQSDTAPASTDESPAKADAPLKPESGTTDTPTAAPEASAKPNDQKRSAKAEPKSDEARAKGDETTVAKNPVIKPGDWNQWGGTSLRNNTPVAENIPVEWNPGEFDRKTGAWKAEGAENIKWVAALGSQSYGNTVVSGGKVLIGTNNTNGYLKRYPSDVDLGVLACFDEKDGKFLWQHSSEKLPTGRVHDWPMLGLCSSPLVEGDRVWFVTSRGEVVCADLEGFLDGEDDGPVKNVPARLFDVMRGDEGSEDKVAGYLADLEKGSLPADLRKNFADAGMPLPEGDIAVKLDEKAKGPKKWTFQATVGDENRDFFLTMAGPRLSAFKLITPADKTEADVIWVYDMMGELGTSQHNMCSCSVTSFGDLLFVNTSNGVDEAHITIPAPDAPSFMAMNKNTGEVYWTDNSPGRNILHGQWSSPTVAVIDGVPQVIFGGGDAWLYSFKANEGKDGKPELLWKFDSNPKHTILELGGRGTRNDIIGTPVVYDNKVYFATGQDPEHGEGVGILWCLDPTKRGDISEELAVNRKDPEKPIPVKRIQAVVEEDGDKAIPNPNSGVVWKYAVNDANGDGKIEFDEQFHRSISSVAIKDDLLFVPDFSGLFHCVDAKTGKVHWTYDMLAAAWSSPMIVGDKVYVADEDGDVAVFDLSAEKHDPLAEINMLNAVYSSPIVANGVLLIANRDHIFAIAAGAEAKAEAPKAGGGQ